MSKNGSPLAMPFARSAVNPGVSPGQGQPPYLPPWIYPPVQFVPIDETKYVPLPAIGAQAAVVQFQVPHGNNGIINTYGNNFVGGGWTEGSGEIVWQIFRDQALTNAVKGYNNILASLGSPASPTRHPSGFRIFENEFITLVIKNVSVVVAGQLSGGRFAGWYYPKIYENPNIFV